MRYFGSRAWKGTLEKVEQPGSTSRTQSTESPRSSRKIKAFVGPSSDMLAPVVGVTHDFDAIMLNHQSISLAKGWELGGWDFNIFDSFDSYRTNEGRVVEQKDGKTDSSFESLLLSQSRGRVFDLILFFVFQTQLTHNGFCQVFRITDT